MISESKLILSITEFLDEQMKQIDALNYFKIWMSNEPNLTISITENLDD